EDLVETGPRNGPRIAGHRQPRDAVGGGVWPRRVLAVREHEDVGIDGDHEPWPSYARSRIAAQPPSRNSGRSPRPRNLTLRRVNRFAAPRRLLSTCRSPSSTSARIVVPVRAASSLAALKMASAISMVV